MDGIIIVGSGVAGHSAAAELHRLAPERSVTVIGAESGLPYDRPPLSKAWLLDDTPTAPVFRSAAIYQSGVMLRDGVSVRAIDRRGRRVALSDGTQLPYGGLLLATGSRLRRLPFAPEDARRIFYLRTLADARRLRAALIDSRVVAIVGGGFIGLEVAAAARQRGCAVVVLEREAEILGRAASSFLARQVRAMHRQNGVDILTGVDVRDMRADAAGVSITTSAGALRADVVLVGVGIVPNVELAEQAGLAVDDGILVDAAGYSSDGSILAAGEVTNHPTGRLGLRGRTESWSSACGQSVAAARTLLGRPTPFDELPWFWSDQYDANIQSLGLMGSATRFLCIGDPPSGRWLRIGLDRADRLAGAEAFNMGREMSALRRADRTGQPVPASLLGLARDDAAERAGMRLVWAGAATAPSAGSAHS